MNEQRNQYYEIPATTEVSDSDLLNWLESNISAKDCKDFAPMLIVHGTWRRAIKSAMNAKNKRDL